MILSDLWGGVVSTVTGLKTTLIASAAVGVIAFGSGWYLGTTHESKIMANASTHAATEAQAAQRKQDEAEWAQAKADTDKRAAEQEASNQALKDLLVKANSHKVLTPSKCLPQELPKVTSDAMHLLNDPALIGGAQ